MTAADRAARAAEADKLCAAAYDGSGGPEVGAALVAVGGYGRAELAPYSDLDVVLVHDEGVELGEVGQQVWYPIWDSGAQLDHSVRTLPEMVATAGADVRVASGLLDVRHLAGDPNLTLRLRTTMLAQWRRAARDRLPELHRLVRDRHRLIGELAHLSVPDLKEAEGGLRDATVLKALVATWLVDVPHSDLERCRLALLDVRDRLHESAGRATDRVAPEAWAELAAGAGPGRRARRAGARARARPPDHPPVAARLAPGRRGAGAAAVAAHGPQARPRAAGARRRALPRRGGARPRRPARRRPGAAAARGHRGRRAGRRARPADRGPAGPRGRPAARPLADRGASAAGPDARVRARPARGLGDARGDRRAGRDPAGVGADPAAAARLGDPPLHRRPARGGDLHRGLRADPLGLAARRADGGRAAARHRQGRADRAQRGGGAARPGDRDPDGLRRRRRPTSSPSWCGTTCCWPRPRPPATPTTRRRSTWSSPGSARRRRSPCSPR